MQLLARILLVAVLGWLASPVAWGQTVLVNDTFNDGGVTDGADTQDVGWGNQSTNLTLGITPFNTTGNTGNALQYNSTWTTTGPFPIAKGSGTAFTSTTLNVTTANSIRLSLDFRVTSTTIPASGSGFRFALGTSTTTNSFNFGSGTTAGGSFVAYSSADTPSGTGTSQTTTGTALAINDNDAHTFVLTITRSGTGVAGDHLLYTASVDGNTFTADQATVTNFAFSRIILGEAGINNLDFNVDNVKVEVLPAPEPGAMGLLALGGLVLTRRRRVGR